MNPTDLLFLTLPAALVAFELALLAAAVVLVTQNVFRSSRLSRIRLAPVTVVSSPRNTRA